MSEQSLPPVHEYPGYFSGKPPILRRRGTQVGGAAIAGAVLGLLVGAGGSTSATATPEPADISAAVDQTDIDQQVDAAVDEAVGEAVDEAVEDAVTVEQERADDRVAEVKQDLRQDLRRVQRAAKVARTRAVTSAVERTRRQMRAQFAATAPAVVGGVTSGSSTGGGATDPRYSYCYEANDHGFGPYRRGVDPEYAWYEDADNDGVVCE
jgi:hypothetical protein